MIRIYVDLLSAPTDYGQAHLSGEVKLTGIELLDLFAIASLPTAPDTKWVSAHDRREPTTPEDRARYAYRQARAMLAERERKDGAA